MQTITPKSNAQNISFKKSHTVKQTIKTPITKLETPSLLNVKATDESSPLKQFNTPNHQVQLHLKVKPTFNDQSNPDGKQQAIDTPITKEEDKDKNEIKYLKTNKPEESIQST